MKAMHIIGIVLFGFGLFVAFDNANMDFSALAGWCFILGSYGLAFSITSLVKHNKAA